MMNYLLIAYLMFAPEWFSVSGHLNRFVSQQRNNHSMTAQPYRADWWQSARVRGEDKEGGGDDMRERGREREKQIERDERAQMMLF